MTGLEERFPQLATFFGAYLYEDWLDEFASPDAAFEAFLERLSATELAETEDQLRALIASVPDLEGALSQLGSNFSPKLDYGWDNRAWLSDLIVAVVVRRAADGDPNPGARPDQGDA